MSDVVRDFVPPEIPAPFDEESYRNKALSELAICLNSFIESRESLIKALRKLNKDVEDWMIGYKSANVAGTALGFIGTSFVVAGLLLALPTGGVSLSLTITGLTCEGVAVLTKFVAEITDFLKKKNYLKEMLNLSAESSRLGQQLDNLISALFGFRGRLNIYGVEKEVDKQEREDQIDDATQSAKSCFKLSKFFFKTGGVIKNGAKVAKPVVENGATGFQKTGIHLIKIGGEVEATVELGTKVGGQVADDGIASFLALLGINVSKTASKVLAAGGGFALSALDIYFLVRLLKNKHVITKRIDAAINNMMTELPHLESIKEVHENNSLDYYVIRKHWEIFHKGIYTAPVWKKKSEYPVCMEPTCEIKFSFFGTSSPHHCRHCGGIFCIRHANRLIPILKFNMMDEVRVCDPCFLIIKKEQRKFMEETNEEETSSDSAPQLVPKSERPDCSFCKKEFTFFMLRHHCRHCGEVFCDDHSKTRVAIPKFGIRGKVRVCDNCSKVINRENDDRDKEKM